MNRILKSLKYVIYYDTETRNIYVRYNIKTIHINKLRQELYSHGYYYNNLIIGKNYDGEQ